MSRLARNSVAVGLTTLLISSAVAFSANGADSDHSYAAGRFISGTIAGTDLDQVVALHGVRDIAEDGEAVANPLTLSALQVPIVDLPDGLELDVADFLSPPEGEAGVANQYGKAEVGHAVGASGAINDTGGALRPDDDYPSEARISLTGGLLNGTDERLAEIDLTIGALSSITEIRDGEPDDRVGSIGSLTIGVGVPLLGELVGDVTNVAGSAQEHDDITLSPAQLCEVLGSASTVTTNTLFDQLDDLGLGAVSTALEGLLATLELTGSAPDTVDLCNPASPLAPILTPTVTEPILANLVEIDVTGLGDLEDGIENFSGDGVTVHANDGTITFDLGTLLGAADLDLTNLPPNTDLTAFITDELIQSKIAAVLEGAINDALASLDAVDVTVSVGGTQVLDLSDLKDQLPEVVAPLVEALDEGAEQLTSALAPVDDLLGELAPELNRVVALTGNRHYAPTSSPTIDHQAEVSGSAVGDYYRTSALVVQLAEGELADLDLGSSEAAMLPEEVADADIDSDTVADADTDSDADTDTDVSADTDSDSDNDSDSDVSADGLDADSDVSAMADSDSAADSDVAASLANAGAPNLLPFFLLGLALVAFGLAVMIDERRRVGRVA